MTRTVLSLLAFIFVLVLGLDADRAFAWEFSQSEDAITGNKVGFAFESGPDNALLIFRCESNQPIEDFIVGGRTSRSDELTDGAQRVAWRIDNDDAFTEDWFSTPKIAVALSQGQPAVDFAVAVATAKQRIVFRHQNRTAVFGVRGLPQAIFQLFEFCGLTTAKRIP